jgi:hypothetical protein
MKDNNKDPSPEEIDEIWKKREKGNNGKKISQKKYAAIRDGICPECGAALVKGKLGSYGSGVGQAYSQAHMRSYDICFELSCSNCGLVIKKGSYSVRE